MCWKFKSPPNRIVCDPLILVALAVYSYTGWMYSSAGYDAPMVTKLLMAKFGTPPVQGRGPLLVPGIPSTSKPYLTLDRFGNSIWCELVLPQLPSTTNVGLIT